MSTPDQPIIYLTRSELTSIIDAAVTRAVAEALDGRRKQQHIIAVGYKDAQEKSNISRSKLIQMRKDKRYRKAFLQDGRKVIVYIDILLDLMRAS